MIRPCLPIFRYDTVAWKIPIADFYLASIGNGMLIPQDRPFYPRRLCHAGDRRIGEVMAVQGPRAQLQSGG